MPHTTKPRTNPKTAVNATVERPPDTMTSEVLTLAETAAYLRLPEADVLRLVRTERLPGRPVGEDWRFLKTALQDWLRMPAVKPGKEAIRARIGSWKDDPDLDDMLKAIFRKRGRPMTEDGE
jgi:excisionase family DNA binding protein